MMSDWVPSTFEGYYGQHSGAVRTLTYCALHACTTRSSGRRNDRAHDLVDLALLEPLVRADPSAVGQACVEIFQARAMQPWPPSLTKEGHWPGIYAKAVDGLEHIVPESLDGATDLVTALIADPDLSTPLTRRDDI